MSQITKRPVSEAMESLLFEKIELLDHGYIIPVDYMGVQSSITNAARVSYGEGTKAIKDDIGLLRYLYSHQHMSPFEMAEIKIEIKLPIFVMRQWIRHRTANINEYSARYSILLKEFYIPKPENVAAQSTLNKQGREPVPMSISDAIEYTKRMEKLCDEAYDTYEMFLSDNAELSEDWIATLPLARELARIVLPVNVYTKAVWKCDVRNLLHLIGLRMDPHAQYEVRVYAEALYNIVCQWMPDVAKAFNDYTLEAYKLSRMEVTALQSALADGNKNEVALQELKNQGATKREIAQFKAKFIKE